MTHAHELILASQFTGSLAAWEVVFDVCWKSFDFRFQGILKKLSHHRELLMRELLTIDVIEARNWRTKSEEETIQQERRSRQVYLHDSIAWLKVAAEDYDDELDKQSQKRQAGTCEWIFGIDKYRSWKDDGHVDPILWVEGIPGAGKVITMLLVQTLILIQERLFSALISFNASRRRATSSPHIISVTVIQQTRIS